MGGFSLIISFITFHMVVNVNMMTLRINPSNKIFMMIRESPWAIFVLSLLGRGGPGLLCLVSINQNKTYMPYYIVMMDIKNEDEDGIHSHMLLGKKRGGLSPILVSQIESLLNFLEMNLCSILSVCFSNRTSGEYQFVHLIERQGISGNTSLIPG